MQLDEIDGALLKQIIASGTASLNAHKAEVDALNVFPVPDGDTGTNMFLTFQSAAREVMQNPSSKVIDLLESAAYGALMGARGNSGVIVSQFFRGFVKNLSKNLESITKQDLALGFSGANTLCYQAVRQPIEGTILTVIREVSKFATERVKKSDSIIDYMNAVVKHAEQVLACTPEMLPVLKQAGVVDAGGQGLVYFLKGMAQALNGEKVGTVSIETLPNKIVSSGSYSDDVLSETEINFHYCTEFILKGKELDHEYIEMSLNPHGDCMLVVGDENTTKIHIHTNNPGVILDFAVRLGELYEIQIHNMVEQTQQRLVKLSSQGSEHSRIGVIAVTTGDGMERIFRSLGVQEIVNGGQTMNPSIEDLARAAMSLSFSEIIILPNNSNIIMTANHVQDLVTSKTVQVVPTDSIPAGLAAMMNFSPEKVLTDNVNQMVIKSESLIAGEVTYAVRSIKFGNLDLKEGDIIGLVDGDIVTVGLTPEEVVENSLRMIPSSKSSLISIYYGNEIAPNVAQELLEHLEKVFPEAEVELYYGGQPLYYYLFSVE